MSNHRPPLWWLGPVGYAMAGGLLMALGAGILSLGVVRAEGLLALIGFSAAGLVIALVGLAAVVGGLRGVLDKDAGQDEGRHLEERAERQGLPTEPEAYQDGGLAVAVTTDNLAEAELLAAMLKGEGIPAWLKAQRWPVGRSGLTGRPMVSACLCRAGVSKTHGPS